MKVVHSDINKIEIIQLKVTLEGARPPIWRRLLVESQTTFDKFHLIIQQAMGWDNSHLYEFRRRRRNAFGGFEDTVIGDKSIYQDDDFFGDKMNRMRDSSKITLGDFFTQIKQKLDYTYDFGDSWNHNILVENFLEGEDAKRYPVCIKGKNNCPPEDCGGIWGFYGMLEAIADKKHPERQEFLDWLGGDYDPSHFDLDEVNQRLNNIND